MGECDFQPPQLQDPGKLEIYNYFPDTTQHAKFQGVVWTWLVWTNNQFDT